MGKARPKRTPKSWKLQTFSYSRVTAKSELQVLENWLTTNNYFSEIADALPKFLQNAHFCAAIGATYGDRMFNPDRLAFELSLGSTYFPDIVIGDSKQESLLLIELESAQKDSVFLRKKSDEQYPDYSSAFKTGFFQLLDWTHRLKDASPANLRDWFTFEPTKVRTLLVVGRNSEVGASPIDQGHRRLNTLATMFAALDNQTFVVTYDELVSNVAAYLQGQ